MSFFQRRHIIPTTLPTVGVLGAELTDANVGEVHVYAHPNKTLTNFQQQKKQDKVLSFFTVEPFIHNLFFL